MSLCCSTAARSMGAEHPDHRCRSLYSLLPLPADRGDEPVEHWRTQLYNFVTLSDGEASSAARRGTQAITLPFGQKKVSCRQIRKTSARTTTVTVGRMRSRWQRVSPVSPGRTDDMRAG